MSILKMTQLIIRRKLVTFLVTLVSTLSLAGQIMPMDGQRLTVYRLDQGIEQQIGSGNMCDLSNAVIEERAEMTFDYYGDSLVSRTTGLRKDWFEITGDTVWCVGSNTRQEMHRYHRGMPYLILSAADSCCTVDSLRHVSFLTFDLQKMESSSYSTSDGCGFIFNTCDTVASTYCVHTVTADTLYRVDNRRWYADQCVWPVVETMSISDNEQTYITALYVCPPSEQPQPQPQLLAKGNDYANNLVYNIIDGNRDVGLMGDIDGSQYTITSTPTSILICRNDNDTAQWASSIKSNMDKSMDNCTLRLYDSAGRQWYDGRGTGEIPTSHLYPGTYILEVTGGASTTTYKIQIK